MMNQRENTLPTFDVEKSSWLNIKYACEALRISKQTFHMCKLKAKGEQREHLLKAYNAETKRIDVNYCFEYKERAEQFTTELQETFFKFEEVYPTVRELCRDIVRDIGKYTEGSLEEYFSDKLFASKEKSFINFNIPKRDIDVARWFEDNESKLTKKGSF